MVGPLSWWGDDHQARSAGGPAHRTDVPDRGGRAPRSTDAAGSRPGGTMPDREPPLRGRTAERDLLRSRMAAAARDGRGSVVVLSGAAGSGKSRLLHEARVVARNAGARLVSVAGDPDARVIPHGPLLDAVQGGPRPLVSPAVLEDLPRGPEQGFWLRRELRAHLEQAALRAPVLVCVDDLQWCDPATLRLVRALPADLSTDAVVWVVALRPEPEPAVRATVRALAEAGADVLELPPLDDPAVAEIVVDVLGAAPDERVLASAARAGGVPLLLVELLRGLRDEHLVRVDGGAAQLVADELPARLRDAVSRRTERLSVTARELLQVGAVLGRRFPPDLLAAVLGRPAPALLGPVQELIDGGLLDDDGEQLAFRHDLIRETVAAGVPGGVMRALRRHVVDVLLARGATTVQVATMLAESAAPGDVQAVATLRAAAAALGPSSSPAAAAFSVRALELLPPDSPDRAEATAETIMLLWQCGRPADAEALASTALAGTLGVDAAAEARIRLTLAAFTTRYSPSGAVRQCETALALPGLPAQLRLPLLAVLAENHGLTGEADAADAVLEPVRDLLRTSPDPAVTAALARTESYVAFHRDRWDRAFALYGGPGEEGGAVDDHAPTGIWPAAMWTAVGQPVRALAFLDRWTALARTRGWHGYVLLLTGMLRARVLLDAGRLADAHAEATAILEQEDDGLTGGVMDTLVVHTLVRTALHTGRTDVLRAQRDRVRRMTLDPTGQIRRNGLWLTALLADAAGDAAAAMAATAEAIATFDRPCTSLAGLPDVTDEVVLTRMALRAGARDVASRAVGVAERRAAANPGHPVATAAARLARGLLDGDEASVRAAVQLLEDTERPLVRAAALEDLAALVAPDRPGEAVALLDEALALFLAAGAEHDGARVRSRLRDLGVHRRRTVLPPGAQQGMAALTRAEREVVGLVAAGGTNRRVAEQLFLSPHTVNTHLRNAFLKLGVRSRMELARLVTAGEPPFTRP
ncbi:MAG TPA: AAA family ATPase [Pseudonocardia sp.]|nr:AAA family ATPase [Pseudonocardia sp.]